MEQNGKFISVNRKCYRDILAAKKVDKGRKRKAQKRRS